MNKEEKIYADLRKLAEDFDGEILFPSDTPISNTAFNLGLSIDFMLSLKREESMNTTRPAKKLHILNSISDGLHPNYDTNYNRILKKQLIMLVVVNGEP